MVDRPELFRLHRRGAGNQQGVGGREAELFGRGRAPFLGLGGPDHRWRRAQAEGIGGGYAGHVQLVGQLVEIVQRLAIGPGLAVRGAERDAGPLRRKRQEPIEEAGRAAGDLQVVNPCIAALAQPARQGDLGLQSLGPPVGFDPVEQPGCLGQFGIGRGGEQGDLGLGMGGADLLKAADRLDEVAQGAEFQDQDPLAGLWPAEVGKAFAHGWRRARMWA